jgi:transcriptional regulator with XRE-family HTH domain
VSRESRRRTEVGIALAFARRVRERRQEDLCRALGCTQHWISEIELGSKNPSPRTVERILAALEVSPALFAEVVAIVRRLRGEDAGRGREEPAAAAASRPEVCGKSAAGVGDELYVLLAEAILGGMGPRQEDAAQGAAEEARREARARVARLRAYSEVQRRAVVEELAEFQRWAVVEALCDESVEAAAESADAALGLAALAVRAAERIEGSETWRARVQGYSWGFLGNAWRVKGQLPKADDAFVTCRGLWLRGASAEAGWRELLDGARLLELEASLRREQRRLREALALLERALEESRSGRAAVRVLLIRAKTFEELGDYAAVLAVHEELDPLIEYAEPRLLFAHRFNRIVNLCHLGRFAEAEPLLPAVRGLAGSLGGRLHQVRLRWLEARVAAGRGRSAEAITALQGVREAFAGEEMPYDAALVTLELGSLLAERGATAEVKALARGSASVFSSQGVHREARAALEMFRQAAEAETLSVELARRMVAFFYLARYDPERVFEGGR